jgi:sulfite reductase (ferredoxin)
MVTALDIAQEIDTFEAEVELRRQGRIDERVFAETRLRRGYYGQRYDNGQRHDGLQLRKLEYPNSALTKGPNTLWDAPGMQRIKIPFGALNATQLETIAELAEEYSDGIAHVTTRQDFQLHFIHIDDVIALQRRLASVGITTREACGNSVRNVTACPLSGVCQTESFDVSPYAKALAYYLLGHPGTQDYGRKFKIAFSGCRDEACGLARIHDIGAIAVVRDGKRGFEFWVGGGMGSVPYQAKLYDEFIPEEELLPTALAIGRVFAKLGEKKNRQTARMKFVVAKLGIEEFRKRVEAERAALEYDPRWTSYLAELDHARETPLRPSSLIQIKPAMPAGLVKWLDSNTYQQRQAGYRTVAVALPLGDITADQLRALADLARQYVRETVRLTVEQNIVLRWVAENDLPAVYEALQAANLAMTGPGSITDIASCPGTDTCKLGISSSRGLSSELRSRLLQKIDTLDPTIRRLKIKVSGCFNSCGQHQAADLGFYGVNRNKNGYAVPHFQVVLGGQWMHNAGAYGLAIGAVPSKHVPEALEVILSRYLADKASEESFQDFIKRIGKAECKRMLEPLMAVPAHEVDSNAYTDWADVREYTMEDIGIGECAGEVITSTEFALTGAERRLFEAQLALEKGQPQIASKGAWEAMLQSANALLDWRGVPNPSDPVAAFREHLYDTQLIFDPFTGGHFAQHFFRAAERNGEPVTPDAAERHLGEAQLFIDASFAAYGRNKQLPKVAAA